jgi:hypothetical protein
VSLNLGAARTYNAGRQYSVEAVRAIQRQLGMASQSGSFDDATIRAVSEWQRSKDRMKTLVPDGKLGPNSLGCMVAEMRRGPPSTDLATLTRYPHNPPGGSGPGPGAVVSSFTVTDLVPLALRADGSGWQFRGSFRVDIRFQDGLANANRYQYRQHIRGKATETVGAFLNPRPHARPFMNTKANWRPLQPPVDRSGEFRVPGGLHPTQWREDGFTGVGPLTLSKPRKYGYRSSEAFVTKGEVDQYLPDQKNGRQYVAVDTYGLSGLSRTIGTRLELDLQYKGLVLDLLNGGRVVMEKQWSRSGDDTFTRE